MNGINGVLTEFWTWDVLFSEGSVHRVLPTGTANGIL